MNDLQNWLLSRISNLIPFHLPDVNVGTGALCLNYEKRPESFNPLSVNVQSMEEKNIPSIDQLDFIFPNQYPDIQFTKRLQNTPFFISQLTFKQFSIYLIDFYEWSPVTTIFRIFYFHSVEKDLIIELKVSTSIKNNDNVVNRGKKFYLSHSGISHKIDSTNDLMIEVSEKETKSLFLIFSLSENQLKSTELSIKHIIEKLSKLEKMIETGHILNDLKVQNIKLHNSIDDLWNYQKGLNPDRSPGHVHTEMALWNAELYHLMGWSDPGDRTKKKNMSFLNDPDPMREFYFRAYFTDAFTSDEVKNYLQTWWDQNSLPLFRVKLLKIIHSDPLLIFVIYSLALRFRLPWNTRLYQLSHSFLQAPQLALLAGLYQIAMLTSDNENVVKYVPGHGDLGNVGILKRGNTEYALTRFGNVQYSSISKNKTEILKIDKKVIISHNGNLDQLEIMPHLPSADLERLHANTMDLEMEKLNIRVPLLWRKSEIIFPGLRIRWIFKKDRFQITCQAKKPGLKLKINDQSIDFSPSNRAIYYLPIKKTENKSVLNLFDSWGRSFTLNSYSAKERINLVGWMQDGFGLLVEKFNLCINSHQIPVDENHSGLIDISFNINALRDQLRILSKKRTEEILLRKITDRGRLRLLNYHHGEGKGTLVVIIDDGINVQKREVEKSFSSKLGFSPLIYYRSEIKKKLGNQFLILIGKTESSSQFHEIKGLTKSPVLSISYPDGISDLYKILTGNL